MENFTTPDVRAKFASYPEPVREKLLFLRQLVLEVAQEAGIKKLEETLKWGEPSYLTKSGSTLRMDWKPAAPEQYAIFFNCRTKLIETFKELYPETFHYEGKRAILFQINDDIPVDALKHCVLLVLTYHKVKHLPLLGA